MGLMNDDDDDDAIGWNDDDLPGGRWALPLDMIPR